MILGWRWMDSSTITSPTWRNHCVSQIYMYYYAVCTVIWAGGISVLYTPDEFWGFSEGGGGRYMYMYIFIKLCDWCNISRCNVWVKYWYTQWCNSCTGKSGSPPKDRKMPSNKYMLTALVILGHLLTSVAVVIALALLVFNLSTLWKP